MELVHVNDAVKKDEIQTDTNYSRSHSGLQISLPLLKSDEALRIIVGGFNNLNVAWLRYIIRQYENKLWIRVEIDGRMKFQCIFCSKVLGYFFSLKNHVLHHLQVFPFKCIACDKEYTSNHALHRHIQAKHNIQRDLAESASHFCLNE